MCVVNSPYERSAGSPVSTFSFVGSLEPAGPAVSDLCIFDRLIYMSKKRIGSRDGSGILVGYIDGEGLGWEHRRERDASVGAGHLRDAQRSNPFADPFAVLDSVDVLKENRIHALAEYYRQRAFW